jgi:D-alanine-D-alanine ligase
MLKGFIEINCAVYRTEDGSVKVSECERPIKRLDLLSFKDKYENGKRVFPADIDPRVSNKIKEITLKVYDALDFEGVIRIDYMIDDKGEIYLNEINTVPGSLAYYLFGDTLKSFTGMLNEMIERGLKLKNQSLTFIKSYNSGILKPFGAKGSKNTCKKP